MKKKIQLSPEKMKSQTFGRFGYLWDVTEKPKTHRILKPVKFECDGKTTISTIWQPNAGGKFNDLERHSAVSQGFAQLSGEQAIVCVAPPTDITDRYAIPDTESVRAFVINPDVGFAFRKGTWHSLNRYILLGAGATFLIFNSEPNPTEMIDYSTGKGTSYSNLGSENGIEVFQHAGRFGVSFEIII